MDMMQKLYTLDKQLKKAVWRKRFNTKHYDKESEDYDLDSFPSGSVGEVEQNT